MARPTLPKVINFSEIDADIKWFTARTHHECAGCGLPLEPGDKVAKASDDDGGAKFFIGKACCYEEPDTPPAKTLICPVCFILLPLSGVCGVCP